MKRLPERIGVYAILDPGLLSASELPAAARDLASAGVRVFQVRAKTLATGALVDLTREVRAALPANAVLIVNDRVDVALACGADGVHLGDEDLPVDKARRILPPGALIGFSTHSIAEVEAANSLPCDYIGFGPVFESTTKQTGRRPHGVSGLALACAKAGKPVVAIGGIQVGQVATLLGAGACGVAMASGLLVQGRIFELARAAVEEARCL